mmetsp:Transcript_66428/g.130978  ORF Transcript_66428/g.130978 Transcript_66428/m.130978 type:complete len:547 (+) Transcript_66428:77-1717(+)
MSGKAKAATLSDGSLDVQISRDKSHGELTMTDFIKKHMGEILRPFAEHVDQLHKAVGSLGEELQDNNEKTSDALHQLSHHMSLLCELRNDIDSTTKQAKATQAGLEKTNEEKAALEADHRETKFNLGRVSNRLSDTVTHIEKLDGKIDDILGALGKVEQDLAKTNQHITADLEPVLREHGDDIIRLEGNQEATAKLLGETKMFGERAHQEFLMHVEERAKLNRKDQETFDHIHGQMSHMSTMLNENISRVNTHANHLKTTNGLVRPMKSQVEELVNSTHLLQLQQRDKSTHLEHLQAVVDHLDADFKSMFAKFGQGDDKKGASLYHSVTDLEAKMKRQQSTLFNMEETFRAHNESRIQHDRRIDELEQGTSILQRQTKDLKDQVGLDSPPPPPMPVQTANPVPRSPAPAMASPDPKSAKNMGALMKFQSAVTSMSIKERQRDFKKRLDGHDQELAKTVQTLQEQKYELEVKGQRVSVLERELTHANKVIDELKSGLELTEEYWKGLSGGFRETHKTVNIHNELLPAKGSVTLPTLQTPRSARGSLR